MKKTTVLSVAIVLVFALGIIAPAAAGGFVQSPSNNGAPSVTEFSSSNTDWKGDLYVSAYRDRSDLSDDEKAELEEAYGLIAGAGNVMDLLSEDEDFSIPSEEKNLAVSDLFILHTEEEGNQSGTLSDALKSNALTHFAALSGFSGGKLNAEGDADGAQFGTLTVTLESNTFTNFAMLLNYSGGKWKVVEDAHINNIGKLVFSTETLGVFAVVVEVSETSAEESNSTPKTGANSNWIYYAAILAVVLIAVIVVVISKSKKRA